MPTSLKNTGPKSRKNTVLKPENSTDPKPVPDKVDPRGQSESVVRSAGVVSLAVLMSRVTGLFREGLMTLWRGRCAISGLDVPELLRASHAKPWATSTDAERLDVYNGLLLAAHLDAAFDAGLITILANGTVGVSSSLTSHATGVLQLDARITVQLSPRHRAYLAWHRDHVFRR